MPASRLAGDERQPLLASRSSIPPEGEQQQQNEPEVLSARTRITALLLLFLLSTGANWTEACLGPLKKTLQVELDISNAQYGVISASTQLANTVLPIFAGLWIDRVGASRMSLLATLTVSLGSILAGIAVTLASFHLLVLGRIVQGVGVIIVDTAATKLIVRWSKDAGWLGLAISCNFALDRAAAALSKATSVLISRISLPTLLTSSTSSFTSPSSSPSQQSHASNTFLAASLVSVVSLLASLLYIRFEKRHAALALRQAAPSNRDEPTETHTTTTRTATATTTTTTMAIFKRSMSTISPFFVLIAVTQFYQPIAVFNNLSADILRWRGASERASGYLSSVGQLMPIFVAPLLGGFFDRCGHRLEFVPLTALLLGTSIALLAWTRISSLLVMILFSLANALNTPPYLTSLAILLLHNDGEKHEGGQQQTFGCAWGIWKTLMQSNQIIMNTTLGQLQDRTPGKGYEYVLVVLFVSKIVEFFWGLSYIAFDHLYANSLLTSNERNRRQKHQQQADLSSSNNYYNETAPSPTSSFPTPSALRPSRLATCILYLYLASIILASWVLFFTYYFQ